MHNLVELTKTQSIEKRGNEKMKSNVRPPQMARSGYIEISDLILATTTVGDMILPSRHYYVEMNKREKKGKKDIY